MKFATASQFAEHCHREYRWQSRTSTLPQGMCDSVDSPRLERIARKVHELHGKGKSRDHIIARVRKQEGVGFLNLLTWISLGVQVVKLIIWVVDWLTPETEASK